MTITDVVLPIVQGAVAFIFVVGIGFGLFKFLQLLGITKLFRKKIKPLSEEYELVAEIMRDRRELKDFAEWLSKFPYSKQKIYLNAYYELKEEFDKLNSEEVKNE